MQFFSPFIQTDGNEEGMKNGFQSWKNIMRAVIYGKKVFNDVQVNGVNLKFKPKLCV